MFDHIMGVGVNVICTQTQGTEIEHRRAFHTIDCIALLLLGNNFALCTYHGHNERVEQLLLSLDAYFCKS
eukprot:scaffold476_cov77-Skeletonema_marinoi.AAC.13